jgi:hypothetical protein
MIVEQVAIAVVSVAKPLWIGEARITIVRPLDAHPIPQSGEPAVLGPSVTVAPHPALQAQARLISVPQSTRESSTPPLGFIKK